MPKKNFIDDLLDRPIAFNPAYKRLTGSTNAALFVSQCWYWTKITTDPDGWFYKTRADWMEETGLTEDELDGARKISRGLGITEENLKGVPATLYYRLNKEKLLSLLGFQFPEKQDTGVPETPQFPGKQESGSSVDFNKESETTALTTTPEEKTSSVKSKKTVSKETQEAILKMGGIGWLVAAGEQIDQSVIDDAVLANDARNTFEKVFGFGALPWSSNDVWTKLEKLVVQGYKDNPGWIAQYVLWRNGDGKYTAFSNRKIRENPQMFIDTGYPEFVASKAYQKLTESSPAEPKPLETPFTRNLETWKYYERPSFDDIKASKKSSSEPLT